MRRPAIALLVLATTTLAARAQSPTFEVATIKRNVSGSTSASNRALPGGRVTITNNTLRNMVRNFYRLQTFQLIGGPEWIGTDRWDVVAKADGDPPPGRMIEMVRTLVADRFKLVLRRETRALPIYALMSAQVFAEARARGGAPPVARGGGPLCGTNMTAGRMATSSTTMADLARNLSLVVERNIVDKTGLPGNFDLELTWAPEAPAGTAADGTPPATDNPSLFTAVQEQLGLKLVPQHGPVDVYVIDSVERPIED